MRSVTYVGSPEHVRSGEGRGGRGGGEGSVGTGRPAFSPETQSDTLCLAPQIARRENRAAFISRAGRRTQRLPLWPDGSRANACVIRTVCNVANRSCSVTVTLVSTFKRGFKSRDLQPHWAELTA